MKHALVILMVAGVFGYLPDGMLTTHTQAQDFNFKLPTFTPFKKQSAEIKPIQLTDNSSKGKGFWPGSTSAPGQEPGPLASFGEKSREFFKKTGDDFSKFSAKVRDKFHVEESPGWGAETKSHWWNDKAPDANQLYRDLQGFGLRPPKTPPSMPAAPLPDRTAHGWPVSPPKYRF